MATIIEVNPKQDHIACGEQLEVDVTAAFNTSYGGQVCLELDPNSTCHFDGDGKIVCRHFSGPQDTQTLSGAVVCQQSTLLHYTVRATEPGSEDSDSTHLVQVDC